MILNVNEEYFLGVYSKQSTEKNYDNKFIVDNN